MTARDLISGAMRLIGVIASGETPANAEANDALTALNDMIDTWSNENLLIFDKIQETFALVASQQVYTIGSGGNFNTTRPQKIENMTIQTVSGSTTFELPMEQLNQDQWADITVKSTNSSIPTRFYVEWAYPLASIYFWPIPDETKNIVIWSWKPLADLSTLDTSFSLPPGYLRAIRYNLALDLAPTYGVTPSPLVLDAAAEAKANLKRMNQHPVIMGCDPAVVTANPRFNYLTGQ